MKILAIESSCDETSVAIVEDGKKVLCNVVYTQIEIHKMYGGVVPEIASRHHIEKITYVIDAAMKEAQLNYVDIDKIAVTSEPGFNWFFDGWCECGKSDWPCLSYRGCYGESYLWSYLCKLFRG